MERSDEQKLLREKYRDERQRQGQILRTIRLALGWTLKDVQQKHALRVRIPYLSDLESGIAPLKVDVVEHMARIYGLPPGELAAVLQAASTLPTSAS